MKTIFAAYAALTMCVTTAALACDCTIYPFKPDPPCVNRCSAKVIANSDYTTLVTVLELRPEYAKKVVALPDDRKPADLSGYAIILPKSEFESLSIRMRSLSDRDFRLLKGNSQTPPGSEPINPAKQVK